MSKTSAVVFLFVMLVECLVSCTVGYSEYEQQLFDHVKVGMTKPEVFAILGAPDDSAGNPAHTYVFFTSNKFGWSSDPTVCFDSGGVKYVFYNYDHVDPAGQ